MFNCKINSSNTVLDTYSYSRACKKILSVLKKPNKKLSVSVTASMAGTLNNIYTRMQVKQTCLSLFKRAMKKETHQKTSFRHPDQNIIFSLHLSLFFSWRQQFFAS